MLLKKLIKKSRISILLIKQIFNIPIKTIYKIYLLGIKTPTQFM